MPTTTYFGLPKTSSYLYGTWRDPDGTLLGRPVEGFVGHEIHYFSVGADWMNSPFGRGREICWQQLANEYADGTTIQATFAYGADGWGFAMLHDEQGEFHATTQVTAE